MNSSKFFGSPDPPPAGAGAPFFSTSGTVLSATPSPQQSATPASLGSAVPSAAQTPFGWPLPCGLPLPLTLAHCPFAEGAGAGFGSGFGFSPPNRASMAPRMHSLITSGGSPYSDP